MSESKCTHYDPDYTGLCIECGHDLDYMTQHKPTATPYQPGVGDRCEGHTTDAALNWRWLSVERLKDMGNGEFACLVDGKYLRFVDTFRPIKTDREKFIKKSLETTSTDAATDEAHYVEIFGKMWDDGFKAPE